MDITEPLQDQQQPWVQEILVSTVTLQTVSEHLDDFTARISGLQTSDSDEDIEALLGVCADLEAYKKLTMDHTMKDILECVRHTSNAIDCPRLKDQSERSVRLASWLVQRVSSRMLFIVTEIEEIVTRLRKRDKRIRHKNSSDGGGDIDQAKVLRGDPSRPDKRYYFRDYWMLRLVEKSFVDDPDSLNDRELSDTEAQVKEEDRVLVELHRKLRTVARHLGGLREYLRSMTTSLMERYYPEIVFYNLEHQRPLSAV